MRERQLPDTMVSPPGWVVVPSGGQHAKSATATYDNGGITSCAECHGADLSGGPPRSPASGIPRGATTVRWPGGSPPLRRPRNTAQRRSGPPATPASSPARSAMERTSGPPEATETEHATPATAWLRTRQAVAHLYWIDAHEHDPSNAPCAPVATGTMPWERQDASTARYATAPRTGPGAGSHAVPFPGAPHTTTDPASFATNCSACHAVTGVSPNSAAPTCTVCHQSAAALPFTNCTSCHAGRRRGPSIRTSQAGTPGTTHWRTSRGCAPPVITASAPEPRGTTTGPTRDRARTLCGCSRGKRRSLRSTTPRRAPPRSTTRPSPAPT